MNYSDTDLSFANLRDTNVTGVKYSKNDLRNKCRGIRASECYGDAVFRRLVMDQDYIDQLASEHAPKRDRNYRGRAIRLLGGFAQPITWFVVVLISILANLLLYRDVVTKAGNWGAFMAHNSAAIWGMASISGVVLFLIGFFRGKAGQRAIFFLWGLFDYGRDWDRVVIFAFLMIAAFGGLYAWLGEAHIYYHAANEPALANVDIWFYPWFVSLMGFATLGVTDLVEPLTPIGALMMMGNVLSGFVTLGLLLPVLSKKFARRV